HVTSQLNKLEFFESVFIYSFLRIPSMGVLVLVLGHTIHAIAKELMGIDRSVSGSAIPNDKPLSHMQNTIMLG
ncbi:unnamed protein product, partial [Rotaria magnacalcarata]